MSPFQHGEVFVTDDGAETDLDLGHYERYVSTRDQPAQQLHDRRSLRHGDREGAPRRLPRRHRAGDPAHHRRDQAPHPRRRRGRRRLHRRDRRHGRRHREPALPRGDPPVRLGRRPRERPLRPPDAGAVHRDGRRAEDQADAAQREGADRARHPARHPPLPRRAAAREEGEGEDRALLQRRGEPGDQRARRRATSTRCRWSSTPRGSTSASSSASTSSPARPT